MVLYVADVRYVMHMLVKPNLVSPSVVRLEIGRVRKDMYNDTLNGTERRSSELPEAVGPIAQLQEKLYVPVKEYPDVSVP